MPYLNGEMLEKLIATRVSRGVSPEVTSKGEMPESRSELIATDIEQVVTDREQTEIEMRRMELAKRRQEENDQMHVDEDGKELDEIENKENKEEELTNQDEVMEDINPEQFDEDQNHCLKIDSTKFVLDIVDDKLIFVPMKVFTRLSVISARSSDEPNEYDTGDASSKVCRANVECQDSRRRGKDGEQKHFDFAGDENLCLDQNCVEVSSMLRRNTDEIRETSQNNNNYSGAIYQDKTTEMDREEDHLANSSICPSVAKPNRVKSLVKKGITYDSATSVKRKRRSRKRLSGPKIPLKILLRYGMNPISVPEKDKGKHKMKEKVSNKEQNDMERKEPDLRKIIKEKIKCELEDYKKKKNEINQKIDMELREKELRKKIVEKKIKENLRRAEKENIEQLLHENRDKEMNLDLKANQQTKYSPEDLQELGEKSQKSSTNKQITKRSVMTSNVSNLSTFNVEIDESLIHTEAPRSGNNKILCPVKDRSLLNCERPSPSEISNSSLLSIVEKDSLRNVDIKKTVVSTIFRKSNKIFNSEIAEHRNILSPSTSSSSLMNVSEERVKSPLEDRPSKDVSKVNMVTSNHFNNPYLDTDVIDTSTSMKCTLRTDITVVENIVVVPFDDNKRNSANDIANAFCCESSPMSTPQQKRTWSPIHHPTPSPSPSPPPHPFIRPAKLLFEVPAESYHSAERSTTSSSTQPTSFNYKAPEETVNSKYKIVKSQSKFHVRVSLLFL